MHHSKAIAATMLLMVLITLCWLTFRHDSKERRDEVAIEPLHIAQAYDKAMSERDLAEAKRCLAEADALREDTDAADLRRCEAVRHAHLALRRNAENVKESVALLQKIVSEHPDSQAAKAAREALNLAK